MKLYHFLKEKWALKVIKDQKIKVSRYDSLNDPFELLAMNIRDKKLRAFAKETKRKNNDVLRLLCCSMSWKSPLLWAHYADRHRGIALEFEIPEGHYKPINYVPDRELIDIQSLMVRSESNKQAWFELCSSKYAQWAYEEEARIQFLKEETIADGDFDFIELSENLSISALILGSLNKTKNDAIVSNLPAGMAIKIIKTRPGFGSFDIVPNRAKPPYVLQGRG